MTATSISNVPSPEAEWREAYALGRERDVPFTTLSGLEIKPRRRTATRPRARPRGVVQVDQPGRFACRAGVPLRAGAAHRPLQCRSGSPRPEADRQLIVAHYLPARKIRVVVAKPGLDGHDRGAKLIARALRDAGMEVIYMGLHQTPEQIVETVIQEDADAVGLSILSGAHMTLVPRIADLLKAQGVDDVLLTVGGTIPADDIPELKSLGVAEVFTPGATTDAIIEFLARSARSRDVR
jgi:methylmalonyl-CoA mutase, C-terminal domain